MNLIVVVDEKWGIGRNNDLLFRLKKDMKFFRETTMGKIVVMGANTFDSFPNGALPNRINIVLDASGKVHDGAVTVSSVDELAVELKKFDTNDVFIIGGASVYKLMLNSCDMAYITKVQADGKAELFFPNLDEIADWELIEESETQMDGDYVIKFCKYEHTGKY